MINLFCEALFAQYFTLPRSLHSETRSTYAVMRLGECLSKSAEAVSDEINILPFAISFLEESNELLYPDPIGTRGYERCSGDFCVRCKGWL